MDINPTLKSLILYILLGELSKLYPGYQLNASVPQYSNDERIRQRMLKLQKAVSSIEEL